MFKSATFFRISDAFTLPAAEALEEALQASRFVACGATQAESSGWVAPRGNKSTVLGEYVGGQLVLQLRTERRTLPASAVKDEVDQLIAKYKEETGRERVGAKIKKEFKEEAVLTLMPRAFTKNSVTTLWIDVKNRYLVVDSGSLAGADKIVSYLVEALSSLQGAGAGLLAKPVSTSMSAAASMAHWLSSREAPVGFTVDRDCELKIPDDQKSTVRYSRHTLEIDEVAQHIASGKMPTQLALTWNDRVSFVLTDSAQLKKLTLLDVVLDGAKGNESAEDGFDTDVAIITGELAGLLPDLLEALGGELKSEDATECLAEERTPAIA